MLRHRAGKDFTSLFLVWATGHITETLADIPYKVKVYSSNFANASKPGGPHAHRLSISYHWVGRGEPAHELFVWARAKIVALWSLAAREHALGMQNHWLTQCIRQV